MSDGPDEIGDLLRRAGGGCPRAAQELHDCYRDPIVRVIRRRLNRRLRSLFDIDDFLQQTWAGFCARYLRCRSFESPSELVACLTCLAAHCVTEAERRHLKAAKRDLRRTIPLDSAFVSSLTGPIAPEAGPEAQAVVNDEWEGVLRKLAPWHREIARQLREGARVSEVAEASGLHEATVRRVRVKLARLLGVPLPVTH
jgi:hypothetical protein